MPCLLSSWQSSHCYHLFCPNFYGTEIEIRAGLGPVGKTEKNFGADYELLGWVFYVFNNGILWPTFGKLKYSEKATKTWKIVVLTLSRNSKKRCEIFSNFVPSSQYQRWKIVLLIKKKHHREQRHEQKSANFSRLLKMKGDVHKVRQHILRGEGRGSKIDDG